MTREITDRLKSVLEDATERESALAMLIANAPTLDDAWACLDCKLIFAFPDAQSRCPCNSASIFNVASQLRGEATGSLRVELLRMSGMLDNAIAGIIA